MFDAGGNPLDKSATESLFEESVVEMDQDMTTSTPKPNPEEKEDGQEEMNVKLTETESLKETLDEKEELLNIAYAKISSLEEEGIKKSYEIERADMIFEKNKDKLGPANTKESKGRI